MALKARGDSVLVSFASIGGTPADHIYLTKRPYPIGHSSNATLKREVDEKKKLRHSIQDIASDNRRAKKDNGLERQ